MPLPLMLFFSILFFWPCMQIISHLLSKPLARNTLMLANELKADNTFSRAEHTAIDLLLKQARGSWRHVFFPIFIIVVTPEIFRFMLDGKFRRDPLTNTSQIDDEFSLVAKKDLAFELELDVQSPILQDERFEILARSVQSLSNYRWPTASIITMIFSIMPILALSGAVGWSKSRRVIGRLLYSLASRVHLYSRA